MLNVLHVRFSLIYFSDSLLRRKDLTGHSTLHCVFISCPSFHPAYTTATVFRNKGGRSVKLSITSAFTAFLYVILVLG
jgi:hypothetical protein